jgi:thiol-disulfide isomerase/thioredoxin
MANKKNKRRSDYQVPKKSAKPTAVKEPEKPNKEAAAAAAVPQRPSRQRARPGTLSWWLLGGGIIGIVTLVIVLSIVLGEDQTGVTDATEWDLPALVDDNDPDGDGRVTLAEFEGTPVVLNFFASWCTNCERELPVFRRAADDFDGEVQMLFINSNETGNWRPMAERTGIDDQLLVDDIGGANNNGLHRALGGTGSLPMTAFYDAEGNVFAVDRGELNSSQLYDRIMSMLES